MLGIAPSIDAPPRGALQRITCCGHSFDPACLGLLRPSAEAVADGEELRRRLAEDGYVHFPGCLDRGQVVEARRELTRRLAAAGHLDPSRDPMEGVVDPASRVKFAQELARDNAALLRVLYDGPMMEIFRRLLGGPVRHFDYTWIRAVSPGHGTPWHCDSVYMNRGTPDLYTAWTPFGDTPPDMGGLVVLERSHRNRRLRQTYGASDVDSFCANKTGPAAKDAWAKHRNGHLGRDPNQIRRSITRSVDPEAHWLTGDYRMGDVVIFSIFTVHGGADNHTDRIRLSSDTRYQLASQPADERWVGPNPTAHGPAGKRGKIC